MTCRELIYDIERYCPFNEQEEKGQSPDFELDQNK